MFSPRTPATPKSSTLPRLRGSASRGTPRRSVFKSKNQSALASASFHGPQVIEETSQHVIETVGLSLPVLITEALTVSHRSTTEITACVDPSGWACLVGGRKLFVWRYQPSDGNTRTRHVCKELTLPPSDLAHSVERVCLIPSRVAGQPVACVAVSPEGVVRYWPNIALEGSTAEVSAELQGEECARVILFEPYGCLLATTTSSLLLLEPVPGQTLIQVKPLKSSQGIFSGISRRMSSFIFGASMMEENGAALQSIIAGLEDEYDGEDDEGEDRRSFYVLSGNTLSKWAVPRVGVEKLVYQMDANRMFREALAKHVWDQDSVQLPELNTWLLDLQTYSDGIVLLGAGVNIEASNSLHYALVFLEADNDAPPGIQEFVPLDYIQNYSEEAEEELLSYRLIVPSPRSNTTFIYSSSSILMLQDRAALDKMDLQTSGDCLLGAGRSEGRAVFFSNTHGIFSVSPSQDVTASVLDESNNQSMSVSRAEMSSVALNMSRNITLTTDNSDKKTMLKNAFISSLSGDMEQSQSLTEDILEMCVSPGSSGPVSGSELDTLVVEVSRDLLDDFPNADPRWAESGKQDSASATVSVIIVQQLKDKQVSHNLYLTFLKSSGLWDQLGCIKTAHNTVTPTNLVLCQNFERLEAAIGLREIHAEHSQLVDACISAVLSQREQTVPKSLLPQDLFYREVSRIEEIIPVLLAREQELLSMDQPAQSVVSTILAVNTLLETILHLALRYRQSKAADYARDVTPLPEFIPWTALPEIRSTLMTQINTSLTRGVRDTTDVTSQGQLYQHCVGLADILMDGYASQIRSLEGEERADRRDKLEKEFERKRHALILPLLEQRQFDRAASLAEKYEDFEMLMQICDATGNQERLQRYRSQYADKGFSQFLFNWYMKEGKRSHLLSQPVAQSDELAQFLDADSVKYLSWVHDFKTGKFTQAAHTLADLARDEKNYLAKKKTLLSLSKLAALASEDTDHNLTDNVEVINEELDLVLHQELLPPHSVESIGMDPDNMRVLAPEELIELYVGSNHSLMNSDNSGAEREIKKALDLLRYVDRDADDAHFEDLKLHIWARAVLMDSWNEDPSVTDPLDANREKVFFKTVDLAYGDGDLELVPELSTLMASPELATLVQQKHFQFLMQGGYEQIKAALDI